VNELIGGIRRNSVLGKLKLGDRFGSAVARRVRSLHFGVDMTNGSVLQVARECANLVRINVLFISDSSIATRRHTL
jgi:hypothetical protein